MRRQADPGVRRKPRGWRRLEILLAAGVLALAGCSSLDSGSTASAPDPFLGPYKAPGAPGAAVAAVKPPPGVPPATGIGVLPAAPAPSTNSSVAALAPTSVRPLGDREDLHMGSPRPVGASGGWAAPGGPAVASAGGQAKLSAPENSASDNRTAPPAVVQNTPAQPIVQPVSRPVEQPAPPPTNSSSAEPNPPAPQSNAAANPNPASPAPQAEAPPRPTTIEAAYEQLRQKGAQWQPATENTETHEWIFRCAVVNPATNKVSVYEGRDKDQLNAVLSALDDMNRIR
jgi:hypothetical protein